MKFSELELQLNKKEVTKQAPNGKEFNIRTHISIDEKYDLVMTTLQQSLEPNGFYNEISMDKFFHLNLVFLYTDIEFSEEEREDTDKLYDLLDTNGIIDIVIETIGQEYKVNLDYLMKNEHKFTDFNHSVAGALMGVVNSLPLQAEAAKEILDGFDPTKYEEVMNFAKGIGMKVGR